MPSSSLTSTLATIASQTVAQAQNIYFANITWLEIVSVLLSALLFALIIYIGVKTNYFGARVDRFRDVILKSDMSHELAQKTWMRIETHFYKGSENDMKVAILEADKILNEALRDAGMPGIQLGDRLKRARTSQIPNLDDLWQAHRLRNQIAHEADFKLKRDLAERALGIYETTLRNLGVLD
jgi:hypothetical protein